MTRLNRETPNVASLAGDVRGGAGYVKVSFARSASGAESASSGVPPPRLAASLVAKDRVDSFIAMNADGKVVACNGHVDLGTGVRTAFAQIVAEELDVAIDSVTMILGDTDRTPDQGPTTASASIQSSAVPMRRAAAQVRRFLLERAAQRMNVPLEQLSVNDGIISGGRGVVPLPYTALLDGEKFDMALAGDVALKDPKDYRIVGKPVPRLDIPAKVTGALTYVHDMRVPGMLHGRVVRPPYAGRDTGSMVGRSLKSVDRDSVAHIRGIVDVVVIKDFVGVVATREEYAMEAQRSLKVEWAAAAPLPDMTDLVATLKANPDSIRPLKEVGDVDAVLSAEAGLLKVTYVWPYQMHGSIGPSCAVADYRDGTLTVWTGSQNPHLLHADLAVLLEMSQREIRVVRMEAAGCYGRNCADDASAEAALLSRAVGRPVRVQLMRDEEHVWEPKGTAQLLEVRGGLTKRNTLAYDFSSRYPSNNAPLLSLMQTGRLEPDPVVEHKGDRTAVPQYRIDDLRVVARDMPPIVRAAWMRGVSALPNVFAHESFIDEVAAAECADPIEFRLRFMEEPRAIALVKALASRAGWRAGVSPQPQAAGGKSGVVRGRGFAQHQYVHGTFPGVGSAWAAWVCDVEVDTASGVVRVLKVTVGYDCGLMVNPAGVYHQIHGNVIQSVSRVLKECVTFDHRGVTSREWGGYPIIPFSEIPEIDVLVMPADDHPPLGVGESASVPSAAAIANAIFSATGVRLREVPFTPARLRAALAAKA